MCCYRIGASKQKRFHLCLSFLHLSALLAPCPMYTCTQAVFSNSVDSQLCHLELNMSKKFLGAFQAAKKPWLKNHPLQDHINSVKQ